MTPCVLILALAVDGEHVGRKVLASLDPDDIADLEALPGGGHPLPIIPHGDGLDILDSVVAAESFEGKGHLEDINGEEQRHQEDIERQILFLHHDAIQDA